MLARAWAAGDGPGDGPLTIDLDSTICETYGLAKEGARHHGYTGKRGYHPLLAVAAGTGDVLLASLREGRAHTARGAAHFLRETVSRVRYGGASGQLTVRADSGFYTHAVVAACRRMNVRFSITIRRHKSLHNLIEAIPEDAWTPIPYWMDGAADVAETTYTPFQTEADAAPVRLIVRRVKPTPGSQLALFATYSYHGFITDRDGELLELEADHRRHAEIENAIRDLKYGVGLNHMPSGRFAANGARPPLTRLRPTERPANSRHPGPRAPLVVSYPAISLITATVGRHRHPQKRLQTAANLPSTRIRARTIAPVTSSPTFRCPHAVYRCPPVDSG